MALPKILATVHLGFYIEPIDIEGTNITDNMQVVMEKPVINGVECVLPISSEIDELKAGAFAYLTNYMGGWGAYDLELNPAKPLTPKMLDATFRFRVIANDVNGAYSEANSSIVEDNIVIEGYMVPTFAQQNITSSSNFLAISLALRNEVRNAFAVALPNLLRLIDIQRGVAVPFAINA